MKQILFLTDNFPPETNAPASRVFERAQYWVEWGYEVTVITCAPNFPAGKIFSGYKNKWYQVEEMSGIKVVRVKTFMAPNKGFALRVLDFVSFMLSGSIAGIMQQQFDVVVATSPQFFTAIAGWLVAAVRRKPFVFEISDLWPESIRSVGALRNKKLYRAIERVELFLYRRAKQIIAQTKSFKDNLVARGIDANKIAVVMNGVNTKIYQPLPKSAPRLEQYSLSNKDFVVAYVGTHGLAHDLETVLAVAKLCAAYNSIKFIFIGTGAVKTKLIRIAHDNNLCNVHFYDPVTKNEMPAVWSICDVVLVPLKNSPTFATVVPSKLYEAMAMAKLILLSSPAGEASALIDRFRCGKHIRPNDAALMADVIIDWFLHPETAEVYKNNAVEASKHYTREQQARSFLQHIDPGCEVEALC